MLRKYSRIIVLFTLGINVFLVGLHRGFDISLSEFEFSGPNFGDIYFYTSFFLILFFFGELAKNRLVSNIICFFALFSLLYYYNRIYLYNTRTFEESRPINLFLRESMPLDVISFSLIMILLIFQLITAIWYYFEWKRNNVKVE